MAKSSPPRIVQFLGDEPRSQQAAASFNKMAARMGLRWMAVARSEPGDAEKTISLAAPIEGIECWPLDANIEREVSGLIARLLGGTRGEDSAPPPEPPKKKPTVKVGRETKGRRGKGVTTVWELPLNEAGLLELAAELKAKCGTGGTVKDGVIEIQGDQRDRIAAELEKRGYIVKRVGG